MEKIESFVGVIKTYYDNEQTKLKEEYFVNAGKIEGIYRSYYYNFSELPKNNTTNKGQLLEEINYTNGHRNGIYKSFYENGSLKEEATYINGKINGIHKLYYENGRLWEKVNYIDIKIKVDN